MRAFTAIFVAFTLAGCATPAIQTLATRAPGHAEPSVDYRLPRASMQVDLLAWGADQFAIRVYQPTVVADERVQLYANERPRIFSDDAIRIEVDPNTRLLRSINVVSQDETASILAQIGAFYGSTVALNGLHTPDTHRFTEQSTHHVTDNCPLLGPTTNVYNNPALLAQASFNPLDPASIDAARTLLNASLTAYRHFCSGTDATDGPVGLVVRRYVRNTWRRVATTAVGDEVLAPAQATPTIEDVCDDGLCVPSSTQIEITISAPDGGAAQAIVTVPDDSELRVLHLDRALLVRDTTSATFVNGVPTSVSVTRPSQALAAVTLPITVVRAILGTVTEVFQFRVNINSGERSIVGNTGSAAAVTSGVPGTVPSVTEASAPAALAAATAQAPTILITAASFGVPASAYIPQPAAANAQPQKPNPPTGGTP